MKVRLKYKWFSADRDNNLVNNYYERLESLKRQGGLEADPAAYRELQALRKLLLKKGLLTEGSVEEDFKSLSNGGKSNKRMTASGSKNFDEFLDFMNEGKDNLSNGKIKDSSNWFKKKWYYGFGKNEEELRNLLLNEYLIDTSKNVDSTTKNVLSNILGFSKGKRGREFNNWILKNSGKETLDLKDIGGLSAIDKLPSEGGGYSSLLDQIINNPQFDKLPKETQEKFLDYSRKRSKLLRNRNIGRIGMATTAIGAGAGLLYGGYKAATKSRFLNNKSDIPTNKVDKTTKTFSTADDKKLVGPIRRTIINNAVNSAIKEKKDDSNVKKQGYLAATLGGLGIGALDFAGAKFGSNWLADRIAADGYQTAAMAKDEGKVHDYIGNNPWFSDEKKKFRDRAREFKEQGMFDFFGTHKKNN